MAGKASPIKTQLQVQSHCNRQRASGKNVGRLRRRKAVRVIEFGGATIGLRERVRG